MTYKFALKKHDDSKEAIPIHTFCVLNRQHQCHYFTDTKNIPNDYIAVGNVEWCVSVLGKNITPDYYPIFLQNHLFRNVWKTDKWPLGEKVFVKPADIYKRFTGFITNGGYKGKKRGPYWCSDIVKFENEWRYYIADGKTLCGEWYWGDDINTPIAPELNIDIPTNWCGTLDFGQLSTGELALVEAHHPFACGWYGKNHELYVEWVVKGWNYLKRLDFAS